MERHRFRPSLPSARLRGVHALCARLPPYGAGLCRRILYPRERGVRDDLQFVVRAQTGSPFAGSTAGFHAYPFAVHGYSDWRLWAVALVLARPGDTVVEVGANEGTETVGYSDIVGPNGRVIAFEPVPANQRALDRNIGLLRNANVQVLPYALSETSGTVQFAAPPEGASSGIGHLLGPEERESGAITYYGGVIPSAVVEVTCRTLDSFGEDFGDVSLVVADIEGAELAMLRGGEAFLRRISPALIVEASPTHLERAGVDLRLLHAELRRFGYAVFEIGDLGLREVTHADASRGVRNWVCLPASEAHLVGDVQRSIRRCGLTPCLDGLNPMSAPRKRA
jgi:FkbM family methyltransferase